MQFLSADTYTAERTWCASDIAEIDDATVRLHWSDQPYICHVNDGPRSSSLSTGPLTCITATGGPSMSSASPGWICYAEPGDEHVAHPSPEARILVIERKGSV